MAIDAHDDSLRQRPLRAWFDRAKLGVMVHWGPYSVPAWAERSGTVQELWTKKGPAYYFKHNPYAEWYLNTMEVPGSATQRHHRETYGAAGYDDFAAQFDESSAQADLSAWADLFARAGARYVVLTTKHHDGFLLWPSRHANPRKPGYHARRDIVGDLTGAVRAAGMKMGLYYSGGYDKTFNPTVISGLATAVGAVPQGREYAEYCDVHFAELIERYEPSVLWNDIAYPAGADRERLFARYYERVPDGVVNDRWMQFRMPGGRLRRWLLFAAIRGVSLAWPLIPAARRRLQLEARWHHDFSTPEYESYGEVRAKKWEAVRGVGLSFGNNRTERNEDMLSTGEIVHMLADVVSKNGNLLLGVGAHPDGTFPEPQRRRLLELGGWLEANAEAIFDTRPWHRAEGATQDGLPVRFTCTDGALYAIVLGAPAGTRLTLEGLTAADGARVRLLGHDGDLEHERAGQGLAIALPEGLPPSPARAFRISPPPVW